MKQKTEFEVIIVGAGPSGLATALTLIEEGISDIIVMERFTFPRYKCCAGYITGKTKAVYETFGLKMCIRDSIIREQESGHVLEANRIRAHVLHVLCKVEPVIFGICLT